MTIERLDKVSAGHYRVICRKNNYSRKYPILITSVTRYEYVCTCMPTIDDYHSDDYRRSKKGEKHLIYLCKTYGKKTIEKR